MGGYDQNQNRYRETQQMPQMDHNNVPATHHRTQEDQGKFSLTLYKERFNFPFEEATICCNILMDLTTGNNSKNQHQK